ncbi:MAG: hypothetical protein K6E91_05840 [Butyrivibrio sp.]|nr:hypothetical protein [Butyrivibrio sp.]
MSLTSIVLGAALICQIMYVYFPSYTIGLILAICLVHSYVEVGEKKEKAIHDRIASAMAQDYEAIYYIEIQTGEYMEFSKSQQYSSMNVPFAGKDFFAETISFWILQIIFQRLSMNRIATEYWNLLIKTGCFQHWMTTKTAV